MTEARGPVVVGVDGSAASLQALERALELAKVFGVDVHVVTATHLTGMYQAGLAMSIMTEPEVEQQISDHIWSKVEEATADVEGVDIVRVDRRGYPPDELIGHGDAVQAEMVVVGNRGYGPIRSAILGSTSHRVAQLCQQDVLIVRHDEPED